MKINCFNLVFHKTHIIIFIIIALNHTAISQNIKLKTPEVIFVKGGWFNMGSYYGDTPETIRKVYLNDFYIGKCEVSNKEYAAFLNVKKITNEQALDLILLTNCNCKIIYSNDSFFVKKGFENFPVTCVSWAGAQAFCNYFGGRLPTEAEWEYAAKGGNKTHNYAYSGSNNYEEVATIGKLEKCCSKKPNELGIYNMAGNVGEYCYDWYYGSYPKGKLINPKNDIKPEHNLAISIRGGNYTESLSYSPQTIRRIGIALLKNKFLSKYGFRILIEKK